MTNQTAWMNAVRVGEVDGTVLAEELRELSDQAVLLLGALAEYELYLRGWTPAQQRGWRRFIRRRVLRK